MRPRVQIGDRVVLPLGAAGDGVRRGTVVEVLGEGGGPPFVLRWEDGSQSIVYLSSAALVVPPEEDGDD